MTDEQRLDEIAGRAWWRLPASNDAGLARPVLHAALKEAYDLGRAEAAEATMKLMEQARDMRDTEFELQRQELRAAEAKLAEANVTIDEYEAGREAQDAALHASRERERKLREVEEPKR